ncbi:MAG TPA: ankyrin repeat domain-containing protein [Myxococcota bacterium]
MSPDWQRAAEIGDALRLAEMLEAGAEVDTLDRYGQTALMLAARNGHYEAVSVLVDADADLDHTAKYNLSALMLAALNDRLEVVEQLMEAGADSEIEGSGAPGFAGKTALEIAGDLGREEIAEAIRMGRNRR